MEAHLPDAAVAEADPKAAALALSILVRESLTEDWRHANSHTEFLDKLAALIEMHLSLVEEEVAAESDMHGAGNGDNARHDIACAMCLKLARNLCVSCQPVQEYWWKSGIIPRLVSRVRSDLATLTCERVAAWREAVPSFLANVVAGNTGLRSNFFQAFFPMGMAAVCTLCWHRPELAFMFAQNVFASGCLEDAPDSNAPWRARQLTDTPEGHCLLYLLLSVLHWDDGSHGGGAVEEWASVFFHGLWSRGTLAQAYHGIKRLTAASMQPFFRGVAGTDGTAAGCCALVAGRLCSHAEALGLIWHSIHGLLGGPGEGGEVGQVGEGTASAVLAERRPAAAEASAHRGEGAGDLGPEGTAFVFRELMRAAVELTARRRPGGAAFPARLVAVGLAGNLALVDALHRLRFGDLAGEAPQRTCTAGVEVARACLLVDQIRLCGNLLFEQPAAQDFVRLVGGLRVLLSHCHADQEMPLLREAGIFAVLCATRGSEANQAMAREMLARQRTEAVAGQRLIEDLELA
eukprot:CAMPEP_0168490112 /NCGR_PEP_ID=MMETSP0228-20121227/69014_1 /TAXON_ID=133427 /ORGANISM="Protoceratium reticulatum, Strain CCCM 535 (=CCMP 1889)" /LENGTH=518 /DNA_ID=CAMNT_0008506811 /DNA_START=56 /DNA_END=1613 /DNA_ORIENTATION=+